MLPKNLLSSYQQYKNDTDTVASWLATIAKRLGYASEDEPKSVSKSAKRKAKAKAKAGKGPPVPQSSQASSSTGRNPYTVAIIDFTALADFVAAQDAPPVQVPVRFGALLDRAIATRQWYSKSISPHLPNDEEKLQSDDRHMFFLAVLKKVRDILAPRYAKAYKPQQKALETEAEFNHLFDNLELEEPSEKFQQAPDIINTPLDPIDMETKYKAEREASLEDDFMAFSMMLRDLHDIRVEVKRTWEGFKQGIVDLVPASLATNTAVDLARSLEDDSPEQFEKHGGTHKMLPIIYHSQYLDPSMTEPFKERPGDDFNFQLLNAFCDVIKPKHIPDMKPGYYGHYNPSSDRSKKSNRDKHQEDKILLLGILPDFFAFNLTSQSMPAKDELTRGLNIVFQTENVPLWVAFAATVFLDIHHILREQVEDGFSKLMDSVAVAKSNIEDNLDFQVNLRINAWPQQNDKMVRYFLSEIKTYIEDDQQRTMAPRLGRIVPEPHHLLRMHPWSCGLWKDYVQLKHREIGVTFVNAWGSVQHCAHLYNALRNEKLLTKAWHDMDIMLAIQGNEAFFTGNPPHEPEDYLKQDLFALGASASNFLTNARVKKNKKQLTASKRGPKALKGLAPVLETFRDRFLESSPRVDIRTEDIERILEKSACGLEQEDGPFLANLVKGADTSKNKNRSSAPKKLSVPRLVALLRALSQAEMLEISYPYLTLHLSCWRLLRAIKEVCSEKLISIYGPEYIDKENQLPFLVSYTFAAAVNAKQFADILKMKRTDIVTNELLEMTAVVMERMLETGGGAIVGQILREKLGMGVEFEADGEDAPVVQT
ncbi:hypothetical protein CC80DRAFT_528333 [Byssothecium circinans]|uniref:DUF6604 domain-containing protein n=1 Tax=Byssothecium circinans TaxID=147558 RepID=A0A6A5TFN2_9PLEO|nr:hypothetical protein CC80DRAFT_528333 [Byssothecium circinans]